MQDFNLDEDETEITFSTTYKSPIVERDKLMWTLIKEKEGLILEKEKELPLLQRNLTKAESKLNAVGKQLKFTNSLCVSNFYLYSGYCVTDLHNTLIWQNRNMN